MDGQAHLGGLLDLSEIVEGLDAHPDVSMPGYRLTSDLIPFRAFDLSWGAFACSLSQVDLRIPACPSSC